MNTGFLTLLKREVIIVALAAGVADFALHFFFGSMFPEPYLLIGLPMWILPHSAWVTITVIEAYVIIWVLARHQIANPVAIGAVASLALIAYYATAGLVIQGYGVPLALTHSILIALLYMFLANKGVFRG